MATPIFKIIPAELQEKINPTNSAGYFQVGSKPGQMPSALIEKELLNQESRVLSSIPEKWRKMTDEIQGLIAVRYAYSGQITFTPPLAISGEFKVFINYPGLFGNGMKVFGNTQKPYFNRLKSDATVCTYDSLTNTVTLPYALAEGDHVIIDFRHDGMADCRELRMCVIELAAAETLRSYPTMSENISDKVSSWELNAYTFLKRLWNADNNYKTGVFFFDQMKLVDEFETRISGAVRRTSPGGGLII